MIRYLGPMWLTYRMFNSVRLKSGLIRWQLPTTTWDEQPLTSFLADPTIANPDRYAEYRKYSAPKFFFDAAQRSVFQPLLSRWDNHETSTDSEANRLIEGFVRFFSNEELNVGCPPLWNQDPLNHHSFPPDRHWSQIGDFDAGDIKLVWELNRFGFVFPLVRAYWRTGDQRYPELFWNLVESWFESNPPQSGVNWKCGQEISLRVMSWCFGLFGFQNDSASTPERIAKLAQMMAVSGRRIETYIDYALSQSNNHGISEAMGLWTIGSLFPEFKDAKRWACTGRQLLERLSRELIYSDGAFSQHSMNYHRVMLHDYLWSMRLAEVHDCPFSEELRDRIALSGEFLYQMQDEFTGDVPCYGQDDGALILPLNHCGYRDFRPIVQSVNYLINGCRRLSPGPWDEDLLWLFGPKAVCRTEQNSKNVSKFRSNDTAAASERTPPVQDKSTGRASGTQHSISETIVQQPRRNFDASEGGYSTLRSSGGFAVVRAARFQHRPSQADLLHVDIWWRGENIAIDPGSYSYNAPAPWNNPFAHTSYHNTVTVDGKDQMDRMGRFLWLPWVKGTSFGRIMPLFGDVSCWNGEHDGYRRLNDPVIHRRGVVRLGSDHWLVVDSLSGRKPHAYCLSWLLLDAPFEFEPEDKSLELQTAAGPYRVCFASSSQGANLNLIRAAEDSPRGWRSRFYQSRQPAISVRLETTDTHSIFATVLGPDAVSPLIQNDKVDVEGHDWAATVSLAVAQGAGHPLINSIEVSGSLLNPFTLKKHFNRRAMQESY